MPTYNPASDWEHQYRLILTILNSPSVSINEKYSLYAYLLQMHSYNASFTRYELQHLGLPASPLEWYKYNGYVRTNVGQVVLYLRAIADKVKSFVHSTWRSNQLIAVTRHDPRNFLNKLYRLVESTSSDVPSLLKSADNMQEMDKDKWCVVLSQANANPRRYTHYNIRTVAIYSQNGFYYLFAYEREKVTNQSLRSYVAQSGYKLSKRELIRLYVCLNKGVDPIKQLLLYRNQQEDPLTLSSQLDVLSRSAYMACLKSSDTIKVDLEQLKRLLTQDADEVIASAFYKIASGLLNILNNKNNKSKVLDYIKIRLQQLIILYSQSYSSEFFKKNPVLNKFVIKQRCLHDALELMLLLFSSHLYQEFSIENYAAQALKVPVTNDLNFYGTTAFGMGALSLLLQCVDTLKQTIGVSNRAIRVSITTQAYFELKSQLEMLKEGVAKSFDVVHATRLDEISMQTDLIYTDIHPNDARSTFVFKHNVAEWLSNFLKRRTKPLVLVVDLTLNQLAHEEVQALLRIQATHKNRGYLCLILCQSLTKFYQIGADIVSGGLCVAKACHDNYKPFLSALRNLLQQQPLPPEVSQLFGFCVMQLREETNKYFEKIRFNAKVLYERMQTLQLEPHMPSDFSYPVRLNLNVDDQTCYIGLSFKDYFIGTKVAAEDQARILRMTMHDFIQPLIKIYKLPITFRQSIAFTLSNIGECGDALRLSLGIEELEILDEYAHLLQSLIFVFSRLLFNFEKTKDILLDYDRLKDFFSKLIKYASLFESGGSCYMTESVIQECVVGYDDTIEDTIEEQVEVGTLKFTIRKKSNKVLSQPVKPNKFFRQAARKKNVVSEFGGRILDNLSNMQKLHFLWSLVCGKINLRLEQSITMSGFFTHEYIFSHASQLPMVDGKKFQINQETYGSVARILTYQRLADGRIARTPEGEKVLLDESQYDLSRVCWSNPGIMEGNALKLDQLQENTLVALIGRLNHAKALLQPTFFVYNNIAQYNQRKTYHKSTVLYFKDEQKWGFVCIVSPHGKQIGKLFPHKSKVNKIKPSQLEIPKYLLRKLNKNLEKECNKKGYDMPETVAIKIAAIVFEYFDFKIYRNQSETENNSGVDEIVIESHKAIPMP